MMVISYLSAREKIGKHRDLLDSGAQSNIVVGDRERASDKGSDDAKDGKVLLEIELKN
jgi:hypothetical protein